MTPPRLRLLGGLGALALALACAFFVGRATSVNAAPPTNAERSAPASCGGPTDTPTDTNTPSATRTSGPTNTVTDTSTATNTPTVTDTPTITETPNPAWTATDTATVTLSPTATNTRTVTLTRTPTATATITQTPTVTRTPTLTPTATNTASVPSVIFNANLFPSVTPQALLHPGDTAKGQAVRATPTVAISDTTFQQNCLNRLNVIPSPTAIALGLQGECDLSAIADITTYVSDGRWPTWATWIEYNFEGGITPPTEYADPVGSVTTVAGIVHGAGKHLSWAPTFSVFRNALNDGSLATILAQVDAVSVQYQNQWTTEPQFVSDTTTYAAYVHGHGSARFGVQLWYPTQDCATTITAFGDGSSYINDLHIGTHTNGPYVECVLTGLRGGATPTPTATPGGAWYVSRNGSNADGRSWATAWNELNQIQWGSVGAGQTVYVDGGSTACASPFNGNTTAPYDYPAKPGQLGNTCGMLYNTTLTLGASGTSGHPIVLRLASDVGRNGTVILFGGRTSSLPSCNQVSYTNTTSGNVLATGIVLGAHSFVTIDGIHRSGIAIYGATQGISTVAGTSNVTVANVESFDNGVAVQGNHPSSFGSPAQGGPTGWWSDGWAVALHGGSGLTFDRDLFHDNGQDVFHGDALVTALNVTNSWLYESRENPLYAGFGFSTGTGEICTHPDGLQIFAGADGSYLLFDHDIIGPYLGQGLYPTDDTSPTYNFVTVSNTTFFDVIYDAINVVSSNPLNWLMSSDTFYRYGLGPDGSSCCTLDSDHWDASNHLSGSISSGGDIANNGASLTGSSNLYYNSFGATLPGGTLTNPQFASPLTTGAPHFAQLLAANLTAGCGGCAGIGSPLPTLQSILDRIDSLD